MKCRNKRDKAVFDVTIYHEGQGMEDGFFDSCIDDNIGFLSCKLIKTYGKEICKTCPCYKVEQPYIITSDTPGYTDECEVKEGCYIVNYGSYKGVYIKEDFDKKFELIEQIEKADSL